MSSKTPPQAWGTVGGSLAAALPSLYAAQVLEAMLMAGLGAVVSFFTSYFLKSLVRFYKKRKRRQR
ncbi:hypothetical protein [Leeuwenhoekiella sp. NPDC079379]|uniref:hypothetical protein n=1 Tax=Leeuwenhoekiella sp. NPDC079379 TaxID=3364122 RepID=UPI0037CAC007